MSPPSSSLRGTTTPREELPTLVEPPSTTASETVDVHWAGVDREEVAGSHHGLQLPLTLQFSQLSLTLTLPLPLTLTLTLTLQLALSLKFALTLTFQLALSLCLRSLELGLATLPCLLCSSFLLPSDRDASPRITNSMQRHSAITNKGHPARTAVQRQSEEDAHTLLHAPQPPPGAVHPPPCAPRRWCPAGTSNHLQRTGPSQSTSTL